MNRCLGDSTIETAMATNVVLRATVKDCHQEVEGLYIAKSGPKRVRKWEPGVWTDFAAAGGGAMSLPLERLALESWVPAFCRCCSMTAYASLTSSLRRWRNIAMASG